MWENMVLEKMGNDSSFLYLSLLRVFPLTLNILYLHLLGL